MASLPLGPVERLGTGPSSRQLVYEEVKGPLASTTGDRMMDVALTAVDDKETRRASGIGE